MKGLILPLGVFATGILASACCGEPEPQKKEPPSSNCNNDPKITMVGFDCHRDMDGGSVRLLLQRSPLYSRATSMRVSFDAYSGERFSNVSLSRLDMAVVIDGISYHWGTGYSDSTSIFKDIAEGLKNLEQQTNPKAAPNCPEDRYIGPAEGSH